MISFGKELKSREFFWAESARTLPPSPPRPYNPEAGLIIATQTIDNLIVVISLPEQKSALNASGILLILQ